MTDQEKFEQEQREAEEGVRAVTPQGPPTDGGEASTGRVRGTHSPARGESKDRGIAERGETK